MEFINVLGWIMAAVIAGCFIKAVIDVVPDHWNEWRAKHNPLIAARRLMKKLTELQKEKNRLEEELVQNNNQMEEWEREKKEFQQKYPLCNLDDYVRYIKKK